MTTRVEQPKIERGQWTEKRQKKATDWEKTIQGKISHIIGRASAPIGDISAQGIKHGFPNIRQNLRDLGWGQTTKDKMKKANEPKNDPLLNMRGAIERRLKSKPVSGVAIGRKPVSRTNSRATRDF
jgi:hypothetical protein